MYVAYVASLAIGCQHMRHIPRNIVASGTYALRWGHGTKHARMACFWTALDRAMAVEQLPYLTPEVPIRVKSVSGWESAGETGLSVPASATIPARALRTHDLDFRDKTSVRFAKAFTVNVQSPGQRDALLRIVGQFDSLHLEQSSADGTLRVPMRSTARRSIVLEKTERGISPQ
jgi:hypothetical protein